MSKLFDLFPQKDTHPYLIEAWIGCLQYAIKHRFKEYEEYLKSEGKVYIPATTPLARMIDKSTGKDFEDLKMFVEWVNEYLWGDVE